MKKYILLALLVFVFTITKVNAVNDIADLWESNNLKIENSTNITIKDIIKKDSNYYVFKEYEIDSQYYFSIQVINQNKEIIKNVQIKYSIYDYKVDDTGIVIATFINNDKKQIQLYKYDYDMTLLKDKVYEYNDTRELADSNILITNSYILYGFYYSVNHGQFVVNKYDYNFNQTDSIDEEPVNNGNSTTNRDIIKSNDSLVFINKTDHYKVTCQNASKVGQTMDVKIQSYCRPTSNGKIINYYCDDNKCNSVYQKNKKDSLIYYSYDPQNHKFYEVGTYSTSEVDQNTFIKSYKYNSKNNLCNNIYCEVIEFNNNIYAILNYSNNKSIKIYNKENKNFYKSSYINVDKLEVKSSSDKIVIQADQNNKNHLYLLDTSGTILAKTAKEKIKYIELLSDNLLLLYKIDNDVETLLESSQIEAIEIKGEQFGKVEKQIESTDNEIKLKITISPNKGYELKEVKIINSNGETKIIKEKSFYINNEPTIIEPTYVKLEEQKSPNYLTVIVFVLSISIVVMIFVYFRNQKRYAS